MKIDGACHCGAIRYEAEVDPARVMICHCTDCQVLSGSAFRTVAPASKATFAGHARLPVLFAARRHDAPARRAASGRGVFLPLEA